MLMMRHYKVVLGVSILIKFFPEFEMLILCLGEGNFSFALSLLKNLQLSSIPFTKLLATSFDNLEDVIAKYPESLNILDTIKKLTNNDECLILHGINAVFPLHTQLPDETIQVFDHVVFNFPHLGREDAIAHSQLIAHFLHSISSSISISSRIYLTLTKNQAERWKLVEMVDKNKMKINSEIILREDVWNGYELKRHQKGTSFKKQLLGDECKTFEISLQQNSNFDVVDSHGRVANLFLEIYERYDKQITCIEKCFPTVNSLTNNKNIIETPIEPSLKDKQDLDHSHDSHESNTLKKTKLSHVQSDYCKISSSESFFGGHPWECKKCARRFNTEQGVRTHLHTQHSSLSTLSPSFCDVCNRLFKSFDSYNQHKLSKHMTKLVPRPDWAQLKTTVSLPSSLDLMTHNLQDKFDYFKCSICGHGFTSQELFLGHINLLSPNKDASSFTCKLCQKVFGDIRALTQHSMYSHLTVFQQESKISV
jgi:hypothetical protein